MVYKILQSTTSKKHCLWSSELGDSSIDCNFILKRMLQLMWFFLMFILKEKLINPILIKTWLVSL